mmetsp:Transcript_6963/g.15300  ORF Transcript_6963/g.15300 Transcript_6963/m.15300 type:complete len:649 (+) Transcript_6963:139-2085(+)
MRSSNPINNMSLSRRRGRESLLLGSRLPSNSTKIKMARIFTTVVIALHCLSPSMNVQAAQYSRMCALDATSAPVPIKFNPSTGEYSVSSTSTTDTEHWRNRKLLSVEEVAQEVTVQVGKRAIREDGDFLRGSRSQNAIFLLKQSRPYRNLGPNSHDFQTYTKDNVYMARPCPCDDSGRVYCLVEGTKSGPVADSCGIPAVTDGFTVSTPENMTVVECFELGSQTVFIRNAWPVVVLWYGALLIFLIATDNGRHARSFLLHKLCPGLSTNERQVERILQRENQMRDRLRAAAVRASNIADGPGRYLVRTRGVRLPQHVTAVGDTADDERDEATRRWIEQAEALGIFNAREVVQMEIARRPQRIEYVLKTKKFNAHRNRMERDNSQSPEDLDDDDLGNEESSSTEKLKQRTTPVKKGAANDAGPSTPETVTSTDDANGQPENMQQFLTPGRSPESNDETVNATNLDTESPNERAEPSATMSPLFQSADDQSSHLHNTDNYQQNTTALDSDELDCTICLAPVQDGEQIGALGCSHIFHAECLKLWIKRRNACPLCQTEIATPRAIETENAGGTEANNNTSGDELYANNNRGPILQYDANAIPRPSTILFSPRAVNPPRRSTLMLSPSNRTSAAGRTGERSRRRQQRYDGSL